jgi:parvulin-like peptidyl-prolyl isomerase
MHTTSISQRLLSRRYLVIALALFVGCPSLVKAQENEGATAAEVFATVGDVVVTRAEFEQVLQRAMRQKFYHFEPPAEQREAFRREVAQDLIDRKLLLQEAERRGIEADSKAVETQLQAYAQRYTGRPEFEQRRDAILDSLRDYLQERDRLRALEAQVRKVAEPDAAQLRAYYEANPDKFTEPARQRVSVILLKVDPSSGTEVWQAAMAEGAGLEKQLRDGADFAELARLHSGDGSAEQGGDMGYLHRGMLSEAAEKTIDELAIGEVSEPLRLLEGVAIFTVTERRPARLREFGGAQDRARELWRRDRAEAAWEAVKQQLRDSTPVRINDPALSSTLDGRLHRSPVTS